MVRLHAFSRSAVFFFFVCLLSLCVTPLSGDSPLCGLRFGDEKKNQNQITPATRSWSSERRWLATGILLCRFLLRWSSVGVAYFLVFSLNERRSSHFLLPSRVNAAHLCFPSYIASCPLSLTCRLCAGVVYLSKQVHVHASFLVFSYCFFYAALLLWLRLCRASGQAKTHTHTR